jgi:predicted RND superfamily exporter protein
MKSFGASIGEACTRHYKLVTAVMLLVTLVVALLAAVPSVWELGLGKRPLPLLNAVSVDTDPENMLADDEPVRVFHRQMKKALGLHDMVVVGVVNDAHPDGVFNPESLKRVYELTEFAKTLQWDEYDPATGGTRTEGVVEVDLIAPSTVDNIEPGGPGVVKFEWLMPEPPKTPEAARAIRDKAERIPFLEGTLVSEDGRALCLYLPLTRKDLSHRVYVALNEKIAALGGDDQYYITGLPVAEDVFGVEMFIQMAISAPAAMLVIFLLMLAFFRKLVLIISPMIIAMVAVILTMGALIIVGFPVHIMSSMIPIFIMPIAVLDAVHILSEFFDRYQQTRDRQQTIVKVMDELFMPMLYTSLTSAAGFASLALTPIPPVQVFGVFVALGIMAAWVLTILFMPAYVMFIPARTLEKFGATHTGDEATEPTTALSRALKRLGAFTVRRAKPILAASLIVLVIAGYGISRIEINDNPVKWFTPSHPIRVADRVLNEHFGGTYMAYLALTAPAEAFDSQQFTADLKARAVAQGEALEGELPQAPEVFGQLDALAREAIAAAEKKFAALPAAEQTDTKHIQLVYAELNDLVAARRDAAGDDVYYAWDEASLFVDTERQRSELFKQPEVVEYVAKLQDALRAVRPKGAGEETRALVGKSNSLADIVKTVHRELFEGDAAAFRIPDSHNAVAQCLITYQNSHRADDLWHFVTPDYRTSSIWVQLTSGDNRDMTRVAQALDEYVAANPPPAGISTEWFGLTYINVVWQSEMVAGMLQAFAGSFLIVFLLMTILFRSALWGLLSMVPLTVTIVAIYGVVGLSGKSYDMPVAVLSSLSLGLAVDFAIHFLARSRRFYHERPGTWEHAIPAVFGEPARAITRNIIVIATGFTPLLLAPLTPYKTVGVLLATILLTSGVATLIILPALVRVLEKRLFATAQPMGMTCNCVTCIASSVAVVLILALTLHQGGHVGWTALTWGSVVAIPVLAIGCGLMSRRVACKTESPELGEPA